MTETTIVSDSHAHSGRLTRTRLATRAAMAIERLWPLLLPVLLVVSHVRQPVLARPVPADARTARVAAVGAGFAIGALAALYPLRFFRLPTPVEIDRRIERANRLEHNPVSVQSDRPSGRHGDLRRCAVARAPEAYGRAARRCFRRPAAHARSGARPLGAARRGRAALRRRLRLFVSARLGGSIADAFRPQSAIDAIPPRIDAWVTPPAYTGKAPIFLTSDANQASAGLHRAGRQRRRAARHRRLRRGDAELQRCIRQCPRDRRRARPPIRPTPPRPARSPRPGSSPAS